MGLGPMGLSMHVVAHTHTMASRRMTPTTVHMATSPCMLSMHAPWAVMQHALLRLDIGVLRCSHGIQLQLLVRCGQRGGTPRLLTIPLYVNLPPGSGVVGVRQSRPLGGAPQGGGRFTHVIFTKTASNRMIRTSRAGPLGLPA